jgi:uncharacterized Tic20 family protein
MQAPVHSVERETVPIELPADFAQRLESSLREADRERRRLHAIDRLRYVLPLVLLIGPLVAWRLMQISASGSHVVIDTLAWLAFILDVGVHVDSAVLTYGSLQAIPSIVGIALGIMVAARLLWNPRDGE